SASPPGDDLVNLKFVQPGTSATEKHLILRDTERAPAPHQEGPGLYSGERTSYAAFGAACPSIPSARKLRPTRLDRWSTYGTATRFLKRTGCHLGVMGSFQSATFTPTTSARSDSGSSTSTSTTHSGMPESTSFAWLPERRREPSESSTYSARAAALPVPMN